MPWSSVKFFAAWWFLNILINVTVPGLQPFSTALFLPSCEIFVLMAVTAVAVRWGMPFHAAFYIPAIAVVLFLRLFIFADFLVPFYLSRPFNLYIDSFYLPDLIHLLYKSMPPSAFYSGLILLTVLVILLCLGLYESLSVIHGFFRHPHGRRIFWGTAGMLFFVIAGYAHLVNGKTAAGMFANMQRVAEEIRFILDVGTYRRLIHSEMQQTGSDAVDPTSAIKGLKGSDVYLFFIESYGHTVFENSEHLDLFKPMLRRFAHDLSAAGFAVVSNFVDSPSYGGTSWLAHATAVSGLHIDNQLRYQFLLTSTIRTAIEKFNTAGYRTICVMPGTIGPWPEGTFFGYSQLYTQPAFGYRGPGFGWSAMPDQFVLDFVRRRELENCRRPLFIEIVLGNSHAPFHVLPPFLADWSRIGDGTVYQDLDPLVFPVTWSDMTHAAEAYIAALTYDFKVIQSFVEQFVKGDALIILMGDHQPNVQITGPGRPWSVPVHVISRNRAFLEPFRR
ncbi:MAG: sulfatase-like hydrolase/transferase, partial [Desulfobacterales bacterium]